MRLACSAIERILEPGGQRVDGRGFGLPGAGRRHDAPTKLPHGFFEHFSALTDTLRRQSLEADAAGLRAVVVTPDAVLFDRGQLCRGAGSLRGRRGLRTRGRREDRGKRNDGYRCDWIPFHRCRSPRHLVINTPT